MSSLIYNINTNIFSIKKRLNIFKVRVIISKNPHIFWTVSNWHLIKIQKITLIKNIVGFSLVLQEHSIPSLEQKKMQLVLNEINQNLNYYTIL